MEAVSNNFSAGANYKDLYFDMGTTEVARNTLLKVVQQMLSGTDDQQGEVAGVDDPVQEEEEDPSHKKARTGSPKLQDMYQEIMEGNELSEQAASGETALQVS